MKPLYRALINTFLGVTQCFIVCIILVILVIYTQGLVIIGLGVIALAAIIYSEFLEELEKEKAKESRAQVGMELVEGEKHE